MKNVLLSLGLLFSYLVSFGQDAKVILKQSYNKCQSIQNGNYEMKRYMKYMDNNDTSITSFKCSFKKLKDDSIYPSAFHYNVFWNDTTSFEVMYTGNEFVSLSIKDSTASIMSKSLWAKEIKLYAHNYTFYSPFTNKKSTPLQSDSDFIENKKVFKFIGVEKLNGEPCYHIQVNKIPENDSTDDMKALREEYHFWVKQNDMVPVQYYIAFDLVMNNDTMYQYEKFVLKKFELNNLKDETVLTLASIPSFFKTKDYVPFKSPKPLNIDTIAPNWELISLANEKISLKSLNGQLVLIDFFYKSCYPCMQALPALEALNKKYKSKGLQVIGVNPYDKKEDGIAPFLSKQGVSYTVFLDGKDVAKNYRVSGYPTMFLIDKTGKIIFIQEGYGKGVEETLDEIIKKNL